MKNTLAILSALFASTIAAPALADDWMAQLPPELKGFYIGGGGSGNYIDSSEVHSSNFGDIGEGRFKGGYGISGVVGYDLKNALPNDPYLQGFRTEFEYTYRSSNTDKVAGLDTGGASIDSEAYMGNLYYDLPTGTFVRPYIGGGIGDIHLNGEGGDDNKFAYQGMAGLDFDICQNVTFNIGYKYTAAAGRVKFDENTALPALGADSFTYHSQNIEGGLRFEF